jgi:phosphate-selective porin OprO/OprP
LTLYPDSLTLRKSGLQVPHARVSSLLLLRLLIFVAGIGCGFAQNTDHGSSPQNASLTTPASASLITLDNGLHIRSRDGNAQLEIGGMVQFDDRIFAGPYPPRKNPDFILRRGRVVVLGTGFKRLDFRITVESRNGPMVLRDAYLDFKIKRELQIEIGKFKSPIGLERLQAPRNLMFAERALVTNLIPDRDLGIQLHGDLLGNRLTYMGGVFRGVPDGGNSDSSVNHGADAEFRVFANPFKGTSTSPLAGFGMGVGGSAGNEKGTLPHFSTAGLTQFFSYRPGAIAEGERTRISPQVSYYWHGFGAMAEYAFSAQEVLLGTITRRVSNTAWQASASYVLTGEDASYSGVQPAHAFAPVHHHWGAFQIAGRINSLHVDPSAFPLLADPDVSAQKADGYVVGLNWYLQKYFEIVFNYAHTRFTGGGAPGNRPTENVFITRFQFAFY